MHSEKLIACCAVCHSQQYKAFAESIPFPAIPQAQEFESHYYLVNSMLILACTYTLQSAYHSWAVAGHGQWLVRNTTARHSASMLNSPIQQHALMRGNVLRTLSASMKCGQFMHQSIRHAAHSKRVCQPQMQPQIIGWSY